MAEMSVIAAKVRRMLGDLGERFTMTLPGGRDEYEVGYPRITQHQVAKLSGDTVTPLAEGDDYVMDAYDGVIVLNEPLELTERLRVRGRAYSLFSDDEINDYVTTATLRHLHKQEIVERVRDDHGFIHYERTPMTLENMPDIQISPLTTLAAMEALWEMATDAASDVDVVTAEGTHLARGQRYQQLMEHIDALRTKYEDYCRQLNIGLNRIEVGTLRRVSRTTGRLVPVFAPREYDEYSPNGPTRLIPPIDRPHEDESGLPSPIYGGWGP